MKLSAFSLQPSAAVSIVLISLLQASAAHACENCYHWSQPANLAEVILQTKFLIGLLVVGSAASALSRAFQRRAR